MTFSNADGRGYILGNILENLSSANPIFNMDMDNQDEINQDALKNV